MEREYEKITLKVGTWCHNGHDYLDNVVFTGYKIWRGMTFKEGVGARDDEIIDWEVYKIEGNKYLVWWKKWAWSLYGLDVADCAVIDAFPKPGDVFKGLVTKLPSEPFPEELATVIGKMNREDYIEGA